jgi:hypothetical protein
MVKVEFSPSTNKEKKYMAIFYSDSGEKIKTTQFGAKNASTYIDHKDEKIKNAWVARHRVRGTFNDYKSASSLSYHILWNKPTLKASINDYKNKFNLK